MCKYERGTVPVSRMEIGPSARTVLNALDQLPQPTAPTACQPAYPTVYQVVFSFEDRDRVVQLYADCWFIHDGHWRGGDVTRVLDAFATAYRADGGDFPPPPWDW